MFHLYIKNKMAATKFYEISTMDIIFMVLEGDVAIK